MVCGGEAVDESIAPPTASTGTGEGPVGLKDCCSLGAAEALGLPEGLAQIYVHHLVEAELFLTAHVTCARNFTSRRRQWCTCFAILYCCGIWCCNNVVTGYVVPSESNLSACTMRTSCARRQRCRACSLIIRPNRTWSTCGCACSLIIRPSRTWST